MNVNDKTVAAYVKALNDAYTFYSAKRYDLHDKTLLCTLPKQYIVDTGLRSYLMGYRDSDVGRVFENAAYPQPLHDGWSVHVGTLYQKEVGFVCLRFGRRSAGKAETGACADLRKRFLYVACILPRFREIIHARKRTT